MATLIQVTNVSPLAGSQQMSELFSYFGDIEEIKLYPDDTSDVVVPSKVCFIQFKNEESASTCLHLSNTILIDRALIIGKSNHTEIPDPTTAMALAAPAVALANSATKSVGLTAPLLPTPPSLNTTAPAPAANPTTPAAPLISLMGTVVPQPPPLTGNVDPTKIEEIRRTIYVGNLASNMTAEQVLTFFQPCGEIRYVRMAGDETQPTRFAFVEFSAPESVPISLQYNGAMFGERPIKVNHSKNAIVKPQGPTPQEAKRDADEAMKRVKEAMMSIQASVEPPKRRSRSRDRRRRSRSRSPRRRRSRSPRQRRHSRSRSRDRPRRRSRSRSPRRRTSRSPRRRPSRSPRRRSPRRRSRSRDRTRRRSRSRSPRRNAPQSPRRRSRKSRSRSPRRRKRESSVEVEKSKSPSPSPNKKSSKSKRQRKSSRSPSPVASPGSRSSSRRKKHSRKHKHRHRSPEPENGRGSPALGSASEKEGVANASQEVAADSDSSC